MKKNFLLGITGLVLVFLTVLSGCNTPLAELPVKELRPQALPAPSEVRAIAYEGLNIITWKPVANAYGYRVYRQDRSSSQESLGVNPVEITWPVGTQGRDPDLNTALQLYYTDIVGFSNQLVNDHEYVYYVEAVSGISPTPGRAADGYDPNTDLPNDASSLADGYVYNSELAGSNGIRAIIPERNGTYDWIAVENITVEKAYTSSTDEIVVTWDAKPNLTYSVAYTWGVGTDTGIDRDNLAPIAYTVTYDYSPFKYVGNFTLPAVGGTNSITVYATFAGGDAYFNKRASDTANAVYDLGLGKPDNFSSDRVTDNPWVVLRWDTVTDAESYAVYRAESVGGTTLIGDWAAVANAYELNGDATGYILYDRTAALDKAYRYMVVAVKGSGASAIRSLPSTDTVSVGSSLNTRPTTPAGFAAVWTNQTDVKVSWTRPLNSNVTYKLYRGAAAFKNEATGNLVNLTSYDYNDETEIAVTSANYITATTVVVVDRPAAAPAGKAWVYRVVAQQYGYDSESGFAAIGLLTAPDATTLSFAAAAYALNPTQASITWNVPVDLYGAKFTLTRARIVTPDASVSPVTLATIQEVTSYSPVNTADGVVPPASYQEGRAVVLDTAVTTRSRWLYRLVVEKDGLVSEPVYDILEGTAFASTTNASLSLANTPYELYPDDPGNNTAYQAANTIRLALNMGSTYLADNPLIKVYRREAAAPETAFEEVSPGFTAAQALVTPTLYWIDTGVDYSKTYIYKVVVYSADGSVRFTNSGTGDLSTALRPAYAISIGTLSIGTPPVAGQRRINVSAGAYVENLRIKFRVRNTVSTTNFAGIPWTDAVIGRTSTGTGTTASPYAYTYSFNITGLTPANYALQYYLDIPGTVTVPGDSAAAAISFAAP
jgi:fibronectin type 3 domain-containing protein